VVETESIRIIPFIGVATYSSLPASFLRESNFPSFQLLLRESNFSSSYFPLPLWERNKKVRGLKMDNQKTTDLSKVLRRQGTPAERILWTKLRNKQLAGVKFRRQQSLGNYVVDFATFEKKLVIEIDGGQHNEDHIAGRDEERTAWLKSQGFRVIRFWNNEVIENLDGVLLRIQEVIGIDTPSPST
jgi:very-short-patch-repair endonuclease